MSSEAVVECRGSNVDITCIHCVKVICYLWKKLITDIHTLCEGDVLSVGKVDNRPPSCIYLIASVNYNYLRDTVVLCTKSKTSCKAMRRVVDDRGNRAN